MLSEVIIASDRGTCVVGWRAASRILGLYDPFVAFVTWASLDAHAWSYTQLSGRRRAMRTAWICAAHGQDVSQQGIRCEVSSLNLTDTRSCNPTSWCGRIVAECSVIVRRLAVTSEGAEMKKAPGFGQGRGGYGDLSRDWFRVFIACRQSAESISARSPNRRPTGCSLGSGTAKGGAVSSCS